MPFKPHAIYPTYEINVSFYSYFSWFSGVSHWQMKKIFAAANLPTEPGSGARAAPSSLRSPALPRCHLPTTPPWQSFSTLRSRCCRNFAAVAPWRVWWGRPPQRPSHPREDYSQSCPKAANIHNQMMSFKRVSHVELDGRANERWGFKPQTSQLT